MFEERIAENFPNLGKETVTHRKQHSKQVNPQKNTPKHTVIKMIKIKDKQNIRSSKR